MIDTDVAFHLFLCAVYIGCNFAVQILPFLLLGAYSGNIWCRLVISIQILDLVTPLHPGPQGFWRQFSNFSDNTEGMEKYNGLEIHCEGTLEKEKNYLLCYFPHSLYGCGLFALRRYFSRRYGSNMLFSGADVIFKLPILRRLMTWWGLTKVSRSSLKETLSLPYPYNILMFQPDGIAGMFYGLEDEQIVLERRRGFCKVALETGADLIPCYVLGANELYNRTWGANSRAAELSHKFHVSLVFWTGRFGMPFGFVPNATKLVIAVGSPINVSKVESPTRDQVDALHRTFVKELKELYGRHKHRMGEAWAQAHDRLYLENEMTPSKHRKKLD